MYATGGVQDGKPGPGRPLGSTDKKWRSAQYWFDLLQEQLPHLQPKEIADIAMKGFAVVVSKLSDGSGSQEASIKNAEAAAAALKRMEEAVESAFGSGSPRSDFPRVENGTPKIQTNGSAGGAL